MQNSKMVRSDFIDNLSRQRRLYMWCGVFCCLTAPGILVVLIMYETKNKENIPMIFGGYCAVWATIFCMFHIMEHLACFTQPEKQSKIVRILFMVPLYAMTSWLSLCFGEGYGSLYLALIRDSYESYALYNFFTLMLELLGGVDALYRMLMSEDRELLQHLWPLCWLEPFKFSPRFVMVCQRCMFQFMVVKPVTTFSVILMTATDTYGDSLSDFTKGYPYAFWAYNISITVALTAVVYFYHATASFLSEHRPLGKFLCIKTVVFLTFWQGVVIQVMVAIGALPRTPYWTEKEVAVGLQDLAICVEMLFCSFAHKVCFNADVYSPEHLVSGKDSRREMDMVDDDDTGQNPENDRSVTGVTPLPGSSPWVSLVYTLRHEDIKKDFIAMVHGR